MSTRDFLDAVIAASESEHPGFAEMVDDALRRRVPTIRVDLATLTAEVSAGTLGEAGLRRLEQEAAAAVSAIRRENKRRDDYARREEHVSMFRRRFAYTLREAVLPGDPPRPALVGLYSACDEVWPVAIAPATGQDVRIGWRDLDPSPWGSLWLTRTPRGHTAHRWDGGARYACGQGAGMPLPWDRRRSVYAAHPAARPCPTCARTLTPDFHPSTEARAPGYVGEKKEAP